MPSAYNVTTSACVLGCAVVAAKSGQKWFTWNDVNNFKTAIMQADGKISNYHTSYTNDWEDYHKLLGGGVFHFTGRRIGFYHETIILKMFDIYLKRLQDNIDLDPRTADIYREVVDCFRLTHTIT